MIICEVNKNHLNIRTRELLTAGSQNVNTVEFRFNEAWDGLAKTATFKTSKKTISVLLNTNTTAIPWEALADAGEILAVGVFGVSGETIVLPTVWGILGKVMDAAHLGDEEKEPTPDVYQKILDELNAIEKPTWNAVQNKPFTALGDGLSVDEDGVLSAKGGVELSQKAEVGEVLTVEEVDEDGKPTKWKTAPAAAEQKQADWGQNDETAADFVRNRPCYTEWKAGTYFDVTLDKETATQGGVFFYRIDDNEINWDMLDKTDNQLFVRGRKYNIVFDGVTYTSTAGNDMIGNGHLYYDELEDNGMPFVLSAGNGVTLACKTAGEHSIKVTGEVPTYHKLDKRYYNRPIEYDTGIMDESPSRISLFSYTQAMDIGSVQWDYTLMRPTEEEVKELGDELFNMYPVNLYVTGARNMILGVVPYGDSSLIVELPVNVGDTKIISITETPSVDVTYRDTNQYLIKIKETGANKPTLYVWFNTYDEKSGARSALVYYNNALYSMELNTNLKIKRIL